MLQPCQMTLAKCGWGAYYYRSTLVYAKPHSQLNYDNGMKHSPSRWMEKTGSTESNNNTL